MERKAGSERDLRQALKLHGAGRLADSVAIYRKVLQMHPGNLEAAYNLGNVLLDMNSPAEAEQSYRDALAINPGFADAYLNRGLALKALGRFDEAEECYRKALALKPDFVAALNNLGNVLRTRARLAEAEQCFRRALSLQPRYARAYHNLGNVLQDLARFQEAEQSYRQALALNPRYADAYNGLGNVLKELRQWQASEKSFGSALAIDPGFPDAHYNRANLHKALGRMDEAERGYRQVLALRPDFAMARSNLIFLLDLHGARGAAEQQEERRSWYRHCASRYESAIRPHANSPDPGRKLRVGYVSADFRLHSASLIFEPILCAHDREEFEVILYSGVKREDETTARLRQGAQGWHSTRGMPDDMLAEQIRRDGIDILVDLSGHTDGHRLLTFARKPAPVQVTAWGHATGTGLPAIDYFLADPVLVPPQERSLYAEEVVDLPCCVCFGSPDYLPEVSPPAPAGRPFTFGCLNRLEKISGTVIALWRRILNAHPGGRLLVKAHGLEDTIVRDDFLRRLAAAGIAADRIELRGHSLHAEHLEGFHDVDLALDPYPHGGGVSTLEALWMGVPVVTLMGSTAASRLSASILTAAEMPEWIARSDEEYVRLAIEAAQDRPRLASLRQGLRAHMNASVIGDTQRYTRAVEAAYRSMWRRWCEKAAGTAAGTGASA